MENKKPTKKEMFNLIKTLLEENTEIVEFCDHEIELLEKKKSNGKSKANETMDKNVELVYETLANFENGATATEIIASGNLNGQGLENELGLITTQKVSAYLKKLVDSGRVKTEKDKKKTIFKVVEN
jgi:predicted transcriptional regulator